MNIKICFITRLNVTLTIFDEHFCFVEDMASWTAAILDPGVIWLVAVVAFNSNLSQSCSLNFKT